MNTDQETLSSPPMGLMARAKAAGSVLLTGKLPNPLASEPEDKSRGELVREMNDWALDTRKFWKPTFDTMREDMAFGSGRHWPETFKTAEGNDAYQADIVQRHLAQKEAALYAKNPTFYAERRQRLEFRVWDGTQESLNGAKAILAQAQQMLQQTVAAGGAMGEPPGEVVAAAAIVADYEEGMKQRKFEEDLGNTLNILFKQQLEGQVPPFKQSAKQLVTRINTCGVGYIKPLFRRTMTPTAGGAPAKPDYDVPESGMAAQLSAIQQKIQEISDSGDQESPAIAELKLMMQSLGAGAGQGEPTIDNEGIVIVFPSSTSVLVDRCCTNLRGFVGARRVAEETLMEVADVERQYKCSLRDSGAVMYYDSGDPVEPASGTASSGATDEKGKSKAGKVCVWQVHDRTTNLCYVVCDGVKDFLCEPCKPKLEWDYFWQLIPVVFRPVEVEKNDPDSGVTCYPRSDVRLLRPMQQEINRSGEAYREHRVANRPRWVLGGAYADDDDIQTLSLSTPSGALLKLKTLGPGEKISDRLQRVPTAEIDPAVYDAGRYHQDALMVVGTQPANLGAPRTGDTATGEAIAEGSRIQSSDSNSDDLEEALSLVAEACGLLLMRNMTPESVKKIVGVGAVWPQLSMAGFAENVWLDIEAGSTGRPNQALEMQNFQLLGPQLKEMMMAEGKSLEPLIKEGARRLDDKLDPADFLKPSTMPMSPAVPPNGMPMPAPGGGMVGGLAPGASASNAGAGQQPPPLPPMSAAIAKESATA